MEFIVTVETKLDGQTIAKDEVVRFYRDEYEVRAEDIGLTLSEGKGAIQEIQHHIVSDQVLVMSAINKFCRHCGCEQNEKDPREYLQNNWSSLTSYAHARRNGLGISSAPAESTMNYVVNQRMCKRQPMRWTSMGAHFLLQVRCAVLDKRLAQLFGQWYPRFQLADERNEEHYVKV